MSVTNADFPERVVSQQIYRRDSPARKGGRKDYKIVIIKSKVDIFVYHRVSLSRCARLSTPFVLTAGLTVEKWPRTIKLRLISGQRSHERLSKCATKLKQWQTKLAN